jgi:hypothetical protein
MLGQVFHSCPIQYIMHSHVTFKVADDHSLFQRIQCQCCDLMLADVNENFGNVAIECTPDLDFVSRSSKETVHVLNVLDAHNKVLVSRKRVVVLVIFVQRDRFSVENELQRLVKGDEARQVRRVDISWSCEGLLLLLY